MKSAFLLSEGLLCLYDKQTNAWLLAHMEFLLSCSTRHLVSYRVKHSKRNSISTRAHVLFFMYRKLIRALLVAVTNCGKKKNQVWYTLQSLELLYLVDLLCVLVKS